MSNTADYVVDGMLIEVESDKDKTDENTANRLKAYAEKIQKSEEK